MRRYRSLWSSLRRLIDFQYEEFRNYTSFVENSLEAEMRNLEERCDRLFKSLPEERRDELGDMFYDDACQFSKDFPQLLRRTTFVALYSHFEQELTTICRHCQRLGSHSVLLEDLCGKGIVRAQAFLEKVAAISFPGSAHPWQQILKYNKLRNYLVHSGPRLGRSAEAKKLRNVIPQLPHVTLSPSDEIELGANFHEEVIQQMKALFGSLFNVLPQT